MIPATSIRRGLYIPPFGELADPRVVMDLAVGAEEHGWDGVFLWDHILRPPDNPADIADVWVTLAGVAVVTKRIRMGALITPIVRRRPQKLAREAVTLDHLSRGRLVVGLGLGVEWGGELSRFGEIVDPVARGKILDEGADLLTQMWTGQEVHHRGHFVADGVRILPTAVQSPRIPLWLAATGISLRPVRRAARYDGLFPIDMTFDQLARVVETVVTERGGLDGFDIVWRIGTGSLEDGERDTLEALGVTWILSSYEPGATYDDIRRRLERGP